MEAVNDLTIIITVFIVIFGLIVYLHYWASDDDDKFPPSSNHGDTL